MSWSENRLEKRLDTLKSMIECIESSLNPVIELKVLGQRKIEPGDTTVLFKEGYKFELEEVPITSSDALEVLRSQRDKVSKLLKSKRTKRILSAGRL